MKTKTKTTVAVIIILLLTVFVIAYYYQAKHKQAGSGSTQQANSPQAKKSSMEIEKEKADKSQLGKTAVVSKIGSGMVTAINGNKLTIKTKESDVEINIVETTTFYAMKNGKPIKKAKEDLKQDGLITFEYNEKSKEALSIRID